jgi:membrane-associated protease RseP (regulator of RpoE activity)
MSRYITARNVIMFLGVAAMTAWSVTSIALAQDAQAEATAKVQREKVAADTIANTEPAAREDGKESPGPTAADAERLKRRAGERIGQDPRGRSQVLGMFLQETGKGSVKVVEVGAASPAFEAGVREGDELVAFDGFQASTYRKWIDGIRKLATAAPDNSKLPVVVMRNGAQFATEIRVPEAHATAIVKLPTGPLPQVAPQGEAPQQGVAVAIAGGGRGVAIDNSGPFNNFFNNDPSARSERAIAELFRVGNTAKPPVADDIASGGTAPADKNARIGLAGFRNDANGMTVMVDVGGLRPGNYTVAIAEPSAAGLQLQPGVAPVGPQPGPGTGAPPTPSGAPPAGIIPQQQSPQRPGTNPQQRKGTIGTPQSAAPNPINEVPRGILAQIGESRQPSGATPEPVVPPTGTNQPLDVPPTGQVNPPDSTPTGQSIVNNNLEEKARQANAARTNAGTTPGTQIGTLTVDQSGTGRMQQVVEGMQVRDIVGLAVVIYSQTGEPQKTLPPNLDPTADPNGGQLGSAQTSNAGANPTSAPPPAGTVPPASAIQPTGQPTGLVAAGNIRLVTDRGTAAGGGTTPNAPGSAPVQQPANNVPTTGANPIR